MKYIYLLLFLSGIYACDCTTGVADKTTVKELDLNRYMGLWYEIARFDHSFERGLVGVTAEYSLNDDGSIEVVNSGYRGGLKGERSVAKGKAKLSNKEEPGKLKVSFFLFFYGDYFVLELDKEYKWAVVGSCSDDFLWVLSRDAQMLDSVYQDLIQKIAKRGYDVSKLIKVKQRSE